jgi:hypothetical protein
MLTPDSVSSPDAPKKMVGSVLIFEGESLEQVRKRIEADIYYTSGTVCHITANIPTTVAHGQLHSGTKRNW